MTNQTLVLVGGGHAMLPLVAGAGRLVARGVGVTLVSDAPALWYSGRVPEWTGGVYTEAEATVDLAGLCRRSGVRFVVARAERVDTGAREVVLDTGARLPYTVAALDVGSVNPGRAGAAAVTKPLHHVRALGAWLDAQAGGPAPDAPRVLAIVGGGAAGVEIALNVTARADVAGRVRVVLVEPGRRLASALPTRLGAWAARVLRRRGATVLLDTRAETADAAGVVLASGRHLPADAVLWATGSAPPPIVAASGLPATADGWLRVDPSLRVVGHDRLFAAGDMAAVAGHEEIARIGVHAVRQGPTLARNVARTLDALARGDDLAGLRPGGLRPDGLRLARFRPYPVAPLILSTGGRTAWWAAGPVAIRSEAGLRLKHAVDLRWIRRYQILAAGEAPGAGAPNGPSPGSLWGE